MPSCKLLSAIKTAQEQEPVFLNVLTTYLTLSQMVKKQTNLVTEYKTMMNKRSWHLQYQHIERSGKQIKDYQQLSKLFLHKFSVIMRLDAYDCDLGVKIGCFS